MKLSDKILQNPNHLHSHIKNKINDLFEKQDTFSLQKFESMESEQLRPIPQPISNTQNMKFNDSFQSQYNQMSTKQNHHSFNPAEQTSNQNQLFQSVKAIEEKLLSHYQSNQNPVNEITLSYDVVLEYLRVVDSLKTVIEQQRLKQLESNEQINELTQHIDLLQNENIQFAIQVDEQKQCIESFKMEQVQKKEAIQLEQEIHYESLIHEQKEQLQLLMTQLQNSLQVIRSQNEQLDKNKLVNKSWEYEKNNLLEKIQMINCQKMSVLNLNTELEKQIMMLKKENLAQIEQQKQLTQIIKQLKQSKQQCQCQKLSTIKTQKENVQPISDLKNIAQDNLRSSYVKLSERKMNLKSYTPTKFLQMNNQIHHKLDQQEAYQNNNNNVSFAQNIQEQFI